MTPALSEATDTNDKRRLGSGVVSWRGSSRGWLNFEHVPFFFSRYGSPISVVGQFRGSSAFLIASGPSFRDVDPQPLRKAWTMALNNAGASFTPSANCTVDDPSRFSLSTWLNPAIMKFMPMAHFEKPLWDNRLIKENGMERQSWDPANLKVSDCPNVIGYRRNEKFHAQRWLHEDTINWGNHKKWGGGRSVMLAAIRILYLLGFRQVYLLGVDFEMTADKRYHFDEDRSSGAIHNNMSTYAKLQHWFTQLQPHFLKEGFVVKNCNLASKLTAFPFISYQDAIAEALEAIGDPTRERTRGMYRKLEDKSKCDCAGIGTPCGSRS